MWERTANRKMLRDFVFKLLMCLSYVTEKSAFGGADWGKKDSIENM